MFYPPKGLCEAEPNEVRLTVFPFYCVWETVLKLSKNRFSIIEILKMFSPTEGLWRAESEGGPIVFTFHFIGVGKGTGGFKFWAGNQPFWNLENVLSPEGTLRSRTQRAPFDSFHFIVFEIGYLDLSFQWRWSAFLESWKCFISQRESAKQNQVGSIWQSLHFIVFKKRFLDLLFHWR